MNTKKIIINTFLFNNINEELNNFLSKEHPIDVQNLILDVYFYND